MLSRNRVTLICYKKLRRRIFDSFHVVVNADKLDAAKKEYQRQGYKVVEQ